LCHKFSVDSTQISNISSAMAPTGSRRSRSLISS
jgi:hypothetical protein